MSGLNTLRAAKRIERQGRHGDDTLVHMSKGEVRALNRMAPGGLTRNPETGLPEAFKLKNILGPVASIVAPAILPGLGEAIGGGLGIGSTAGNLIGGALLGGGASALMGSNPLVGAGLGAASPFLTGYLGSQFPETFGGLFGGAAGTATGSPLSMEGAGYGSELTRALTGLGGNAGAPAQEALTKTWMERNWPYVAVAAGLAAAGALGGKRTNQQPTQPATGSSNLGPLPQYSFTRRAQAPSNDPSYWYRLGRQPGAINFYDNPGGTYTRLAQGGSPGARHEGGLSQMSRAIGGAAPGQSDQIPALVSPGEYVIDATTVAHLGDGNTEAGVRALDQMRQNVARSKGQAKIVPPKAKAPEAYLRSR